MDDNYRKYVDFIKYCNSTNLNSTDYNIAICMIENLDQMNQISISDLAYQSNTGNASINRFIKRVGFQDFKEFKQVIFSISQYDASRRENKEEIERSIDKHYQDFMNGLSNTKKTMKTDEFKTFIDWINEAKYVLLVGEEHELHVFESFQLGLISKKQNCFVCSTNNIGDVNLNILSKDTLTIFLSTFYPWNANAFESFSHSLRKQTIKTVLLTQEMPDKKEEYDLIIKYGVENSKLDGFPSLHCIRSVLEDTIQ